MLRWGALGGTIAMALALAGGAQSAVMIGNASTVVREVKSTIETRERVLIVDDDVFQDEEVATGALSAARLIFKDGTNLAMGAQSRLKLTRVLFDPDPSKSKVAVKAALGVFRMATGTLPSSAYQVATPVATISVRGTIIEFTITGTGTTTVYVAKGAATVTSNNGDSVDLEAGQSTTVRATGIDGDILAMSPTDPETPSEEFSKQIRAMTVTLRSDEPAIDIFPGGGFSPKGPTGNPFGGLRPPPRGGGGGGGGSPSGGPGIGSGGGTNGSGSTGTGPGGGTGDNPGNPAGEPSVTVKATHQEFTRIGTESKAVVTITRADAGLGEIVGTLSGLDGDFVGTGSGLNELRLLAGGKVQFTYVFSPQAAGTYTTALPYDFPGFDLNGVIELIGKAAGPVLVVEAAPSPAAAEQAGGEGVPSRSVRLANTAENVAPIDIVGVTILSAYVEGPGSEFLTISGIGPDTVLGAGDEALLTVSFDPAEGTWEEFLALLETGDIILYILTDLNAVFGKAGSLLQYKLSFTDDVVMAVAAPPVGLAVLLGGGLFVFAGRYRRRRH